MNIKPFKAMLLITTVLYLIPTWASEAPTTSKPPSIQQSVETKRYIENIDEFDQETVADLQVQWQANVKRQFFSYLGTLGTSFLAWNSLHREYSFNVMCGHREIIKKKLTGSAKENELKNIACSRAARDFAAKELQRLFDDPTFAKPCNLIDKCAPAGDFYYENYISTLKKAIIAQDDLTEKNTFDEDAVACTKYYGQKLVMRVIDLESNKKAQYLDKFNEQSFIDDLLEEISKKINKSIEGLQQLCNIDQEFNQKIKRVALARKEQLFNEAASLVLLRAQRGKKTMNIFTQLQQREAHGKHLGKKFQKQPKNA